MTTVSEQSEGKFIHPSIQLSSHSSVLSFPTVTIDTPFAFSSIPANSTSSSSTSDSCTRTIRNYSYGEYKKYNENTTSLDAKLYFAKAYGKKDMFSKEIKIEKFLPRPVSVNLEETLLQVSHETKSDSLSSPIPKKKNTTLGSLFGGLDEEETTTTSAAPNSTLNRFDSFDTFASPPPAPAPSSTSSSASTNTGQNTAFFDAFAPTSTTTTTPSTTTQSTSFFDTFDVSSSAATTNTPSFQFDAFESSFPPPPSVVSQPVVKEYSLNHTLTCFEELLCLYKNSVIDKFQLTGSLQYQFSLSSSNAQDVNPEFGTNIVTSIQINDNTKKLIDIVPQSNLISIQPTLAGHVIQTTIPWDNKLLTEPSSTINLAKYLVTPSFRPEYMRIRMNITPRDISSTPSSPSSAAASSSDQSQPSSSASAATASLSQHCLVIGIQLMLNKNYPHLTFENIQVMCSLTTLPTAEITGEIKTRPNGVYSPQSKIVTWRCGNQSAGKQALLQMEVMVPFQSLPSQLPTSLPVIVKAVMSDTPVVTDCNFMMDSTPPSVVLPSLSPNTNTATNMKINPITNPVVYKSKVEYRFL